MLHRVRSCSKLLRGHNGLLVGEGQSVALKFVAQQLAANLGSPHLVDHGEGVDEGGEDLRPEVDKGVELGELGEGNGAFGGRRVLQRELLLLLLEGDEEGALLRLGVLVASLSDVHDLVEGGEAAGVVGGDSFYGDGIGDGGVGRIGGDRDGV